MTPFMFGAEKRPPEPDQNEREIILTMFRTRISQCLFVRFGFFFFMQTIAKGNFRFQNVNGARSPLFLQLWDESVSKNEVKKKGGTLTPVRRHRIRQKYVN